MSIDPKIEQPTRRMLGHAMREELEDLGALIHAQGDEIFRGSLGLCIIASGYIAIDVCEGWPTEEELRAIAHGAATKAITHYNLPPSDFYDYLSRVVLGSERLDEVFPVEAAGTLPLLITANMLMVFRPEELHWTDYLDRIWDGVEMADRLNLWVLPALTFRAHRERQQAAKLALGTVLSC